MPMTDVFTPEKRSWIMSRIRSTNTWIDKSMKQILTELKCSYQMYPKLYGNPDFVIKKKRIVIFCDGDFWHGFKYKEKKPRKKYWKEKIERNIKRDRRVTRKLRGEGWSVLRFWEHDIKKRPEVCRRRILKKIKSKTVNTIQH